MQTTAKRLAAMACASVAMLLSACGKNPSVDNAQIRFLHLSPDLGSINVQLNNESANSFTGLTFETLSAYRTLKAGTIPITLTAASLSTPISGSYPLTATGKYTYVISGFSGSYPSLLLLEDTGTPGNGKFRLRVADVAYPAGAVDVYVLTGTNTIQNSTPLLVGVTAGGSTGFAELAQGDYRIVVTPTAVKQAIYDTGVKTFASKVSITLAIYTVGSSQQVNGALIYPDETSSTFPANPYARVKAIHAVPDVSSLNFLVDNSVLFPNITYPSASAYVSVSSGARNLKTEASTVPGSYLGNSTATLQSGRDYSILNVGSNGVVQSIVLPDQNYGVAAARVRVRFVNANLAGSAVDAVIDAALSNPILVSNIAPNTAAAYVEFDAPAAGTARTVAFRQAASATVILQLPDQAFAGGARYTIYLVGTAGSPAYIVAQDL